MSDQLCGPFQYQVLVKAQGRLRALLLSYDAYECIGAVKTESAIDTTVITIAQMRVADDLWGLNAPEEFGWST